MATDAAPHRLGHGRTIHVIQGSYEASSDPHDVMTTILGSCVCTCIYDPLAGIGGMNHFLLPSGGGSGSGQLRYGLHAMELLINALLKLGADRSQFQAKIFGGGMMHDGLGSIGRSNGDFALSFLETEGINCVSQSLGGAKARRVRFWPVTGKAQQLILPNDVANKAISAEKPKCPDVTESIIFF